MYELVVLNSAARELRKFDKPVRTKILTALDMIAENPYIGELLKGDLATVYSYHLKVTHLHLQEIKILQDFCIFVGIRYLIIICKQA